MRLRNHGIFFCLLGDALCRVRLLVLAGVFVCAWACVRACTSRAPACAALPWGQDATFFQLHFCASGCSCMCCFALGPRCGLCSATVLPSTFTGMAKPCHTPGVYFFQHRRDGRVLKQGCPGCRVPRPALLQLVQKYSSSLCNGSKEEPVAQCNGSLSNGYHVTEPRQDSSAVAAADLQPATSHGQVDILHSHLFVLIHTRRPLLPCCCA